MKLLSLVIFFLVCSLVYPGNLVFLQESDSTGGLIEDTLTSSSETSYSNLESKFIIDNPFYYDSPKFFNHDFFYIQSSKGYSLRGQTFLAEEEPGSLSLQQSQLALTKALHMKYSFIKKNELGTFGRILGGALGVSAVGLGIYHLIKYKDDYFK